MLFLAKLLTFSCTCTDVLKVKNASEILKVFNF